MIVRVALSIAFFLSFTPYAWAMHDPSVSVDLDVLNSFDEPALPAQIQVNTDRHENLPVFTFHPQLLNPASPENEPAIKNTKNRSAPLPPRRPTTFHAPKSFIQNARKAAQKAGLENPESAHPAPSYNFNASLRTPSTQEVLASIEGKATMPAKSRPLPVPLNGEPLATLTFKEGETGISQAMHERLRQKNIQAFASSKDMRVELHAFSSLHGSNGISGARHIALARALAVKNLLVKHRIAENIVDIFPHGFDEGHKLPDSVDIHLRRLP